jgi:hypothetical protein
MAKNLDSPIHSNSLLEKFSLTSLILGIISAGSLGILFGISFVIIKVGLMTLPKIVGGIVIGIFFISLFVAILGLIFGILGLKSTKKKFAIAGIILCLIGLIVPLYYFLKCLR